MDSGEDSQSIWDDVDDIDDTSDIVEVVMSADTLEIISCHPVRPLTIKRLFDEEDSEEVDISGLLDYQAKNRSGSSRSHVDSLFNSDSDPKSNSDPNDISEVKGFLSSSKLHSTADLEEAAISGLSDNQVNSRSGSFSSHVDSLFGSDSDPTSESDGHLNQTSDLKGLLSSKNEIDNDLRSLRHETAEELSNRPKNGVIYNEVIANIESIMERLDYLSNKEESFTIDEAIEIADKAILLKLLRRPEEDIIDVAMAGKLTHEGALLILQAEKILQKGLNLLDQGKSMLQLAKLKPHTS